MNLSLSTKKDLLAFGAGFGVMVCVATAAYTIPIPFLRDAINDHFFAVLVWAAVAAIGRTVKDFVRARL